MISIVIPLYNKEMHISKTLRSVDNQTFKQFEVIIVDDGSTDSSNEVIFRYWEKTGRLAEQISPEQWMTDDARYRLIRQPNTGVSAARNKGVAEALYDYIAFLDADDCWMPGYLSEAVNLIDRYKHDCDVFASKYCFLTAAGAIREQKLCGISFAGERGVLVNYFEVAACSHPPLCSVNTVVSRKAIIRIGGFPVGVSAGEDLLTWARLAALYQIAYSLHTLSCFNLPENKDFSPKRVPQIPDVVGCELQHLRQKFEHPGLKQYIARWHEMRASVFIRLGLNFQSVREICYSGMLSPRPKLFIYLFMLILPISLRLKLFAKKSAQ